MLGTARNGCPVPNPGPARAGSSFSWRRRMRTNIGQIPKNIGIGWLVLVLVAMFVTLALALVEWRAGRPLFRPAPLRSATVARCSVADRWPSDGAVEDVEPTRPDPDDAPVAQTDRHGYRRAHAKRRSSRCSQGLSIGHWKAPYARFSADPRGLAKQHRCSWGSSSVRFGGRGCEIRRDTATASSPPDADVSNAATGSKPRNHVRRKANICRRTFPVLPWHWLTKAPPHRAPRCIVSNSLA